MISSREVDRILIRMPVIYIYIYIYIYIVSYVSYIYIL
jgi:hypothetical protein